MCLSLVLQVAGSAIVLALQTLVSRETGPLDSSVVTVGVFDSGVGAGNIIASQVRLEVRRVEQAQAHEHGALPVFDRNQGLKPLRRAAA